MPMIAFIGVRISWLMLARKSAFVREASSASSFACRSASSAALRCVMSRKLMTVPTTWPSFRIGVAPYSVGIARPSRVQKTSLSTKPGVPSR